jgi:hypothetical protein
MSLITTAMALQLQCSNRTFTSQCVYIPPRVNSENLGESSSAASQPHLSMSRRTEMVHAHQARPGMKMTIEAERKTAGKMILQ